MLFPTADINIYKKLCAELYNRQVPLYFNSDCSRFSLVASDKFWNCVSTGRPWLIYPDSHKYMYN
jgi:hypothetical protein